MVVVVKLYLSSSKLSGFSVGDSDDVSDCVGDAIIVVLHVSYGISDGGGGCYW